MPVQVPFYREYVKLLDGDVMTALMLSHIVDYHLSDEAGQSKLRPRGDQSAGEIQWLPKTYVDWTADHGLTKRQSERCVKVLRQKGLIQTKLFNHNGSPTTHVRLKLSPGFSLTSIPTAEELADLTGSSPPALSLCTVE